MTTKKPLLKNTKFSFKGDFLKSFSLNPAALWLCLLLCFLQVACCSFTRTQNPWSHSHESETLNEVQVYFFLTFILRPHLILEGTTSICVYRRCFLVMLPPITLEAESQCLWALWSILRKGIRDLQVDKRLERRAEEEPIPDHLLNQLVTCQPVTLLKAKLIVIKINILFYSLKPTSCKVYKTTGYIYGSYTSKGGLRCFCLQFHCYHGTKVWILH